MRYGLLFCCCWLSVALPGQLRWETQLGEPLNGRAFAVACAAPGGVYAGGFANLPPDGTARGLVNRYTNSGLQWRTELPTETPAWVTAVYPTDAGVLVALHAPARSGFYAHLLDADGRLTDTIHVAAEAPVKIHVAQSDGAGGYYFGGELSGTSGSDFFVLRTDAQLRVRWQRAFSASGASGSCTGLTVLPGGDLLASGRLSGNSFYRFQSDGTLLWGRLHDDFKFGGTALAPDGSLLVYGGRGGRPYLGTLDEAGELITAIDLPASTLVEFPLNGTIGRVRAVGDDRLELLYTWQNGHYRQLYLIDTSGQLLAKWLAPDAGTAVLRQYHVPVPGGYADVGYRRNAEGVPAAYLRLLDTTLTETGEFVDGKALRAPGVAAFDILSRPGGYAVIGRRLRHGLAANNIHLSLLDADGHIDGTLDWEAPEAANFIRAVAAVPAETGWWVLYLRQPSQGEGATSLRLLQLSHDGEVRVAPVVLRAALPATVSPWFDIGQLFTLSDGTLVVYDRQGWWLMNADGSLRAWADHPVTHEELPAVDALPLADGRWALAQQLTASEIWIGIFDETGRQLRERTLSGTDIGYVFFQLAQLRPDELLLQTQQFDLGGAADGPQITTYHLRITDLGSVTGPELTGVVGVPLLSFCPELGRLGNLVNQRGRLWVTGGFGYFYDAQYRTVGPLGTESLRTCLIDTHPGLDNASFLLLHSNYPNHQVIPNVQPGAGAARVRAFPLEANERQLVFPRDTILTVYPNPVDAWLHASVHLPQEFRTADVRLTLTDPLGREVYTHEERLTSHRMNLTIPVGDLPAGIYYLRVVAGPVRELLPVVVR